MSVGEARPPDHTPGCSTHHVCSCATHWTTLPPGYRETQSCLGSHFAAMTPHLQGVINPEWTAGVSATVRLRWGCAGGHRPKGLLCRAAPARSSGHQGSQISTPPSNPLGTPHQVLKGFSLSSQDEGTGHHQGALATQRRFKEQEAHRCGLPARPAIKRVFLQERINYTVCS